MNTEIFPDACYQGALHITSFPIFDIDPFKPTHIFFQTTASERAAAKRHHVQTDTRAKRRKCVDLRPFQEPLNEEEEKMLEYLESTDMEYIFGKNMDLDDAATKTTTDVVDTTTETFETEATDAVEAIETDVVDIATEAIASDATDSVEANESDATDTVDAAIDQELLNGDFASLYPTTCQFLIDQQEIVHNQQEIIHENQKQLVDQHDQLKQLVDQLQQQQLNTNQNQVIILPDVVNVQFESLFADMDSFITNDKTFEVSSSFDAIKPKPITCTPKRSDNNLKTKLNTIVEINDCAAWTNFYSTTPNQKFINSREKNKKIDKFMYQMFFNPSCIYDKVKLVNPVYGTYVEETTILEWHEFGKSLNILQPQILAFLWAIDQNKNFWNWRNVIVALSTSNFFSKNKK